MPVRMRPIKLALLQPLAARGSLKNAIKKSIGLIGKQTNSAHPATPETCQATIS